VNTEAKGTIKNELPTASGGRKAGTFMTATPDSTIDREFKLLLPPLTTEEYSELEKSLLSGKGPRPLLTVWKEDNILLDGHNRFKICEKHGLKYDIVYESYDTRDGAKLRLIQLQLGRRNLDPERASELRGMQHDVEMKCAGRPKENGTKVVPLRTRNKLA
jgi:hypothetical protein